jgi:putative phosphoesterase
VTRVAVLADTHMPRGSRRLPDECVARLRRADLVLHGGDVVAAAVLEDLRALGPPVEAVAGNMDEPALQAALPDRRVVEVAGARVGMVHDAGPRTGRHARLVAAFPGCAAVVYGHTHEPEVAQHDGVVIVNPGSPTERRRAATRSMAELRVEDGRVGAELVPLGAPAAPEPRFEVSLSRSEALVLYDHFRRLDEDGKLDPVRPAFDSAVHRAIIALYADLERELSGESRERLERAYEELRDRHREMWGD